VLGLPFELLSSLEAQSPRKVQINGTGFETKTWTAAVKEVAFEQRRLGYRRIYVMFDRQGIAMNQKIF